MVRDGRVLLGRRGIEPGRGLWDIPGGFLQPWEHPAEAARREVLEETGLEVRLGEIVAMVMDTYAGRDYTLNVYYLASVIGGHERPADDITELRWFSPTPTPTPTLTSDALPADDQLAFAHTPGVLRAWLDRLR